MISESKVYRIVSDTNPNQVVELDEQSLIMGSSAESRITDRSNKTNQLFRFIDAGDSCYYVQSFSNPRCVLGYERIVRGSYDHTFVLGIGFYGKDVFPRYRLWVIDTINSNGAFLLKCPIADASCNGYVLDVEGPSNSEDDGTCVLKQRNTNRSTQVWRLEEVVTGAYAKMPFPDSSGGLAYRLAAAANPNNVLALEGDKKYYYCKVVARNSSDPSQLFVKQINNDGTCTFLAAGSDSLALTALAFVERGSVVVAPYVEGWANQKWQPSQDGNHNSIIKSAIGLNSGVIRVVDTNNSVVPGNGMVIWKLDDNLAGGTQRWEISESLSYTPVGEVTPIDVVQIRYSSNSNYVVGFDASEPPSGYLPVLALINANPNQRYTVTRRTMGRYSFSPTNHSSYYLGAIDVLDQAGVFCAPSLASISGYWYLQPSYGSSFELPLASTGRELFQLGTSDGGGTADQICILREKKLACSNQALYQQWLFEEIEPASNPEESMRVCCLRNGLGSNKVLQLTFGNVGSDPVASLATFDDNENSQLFFMQINSDGTRTFRSCADPDYVLALSSTATDAAIIGTELAGTPVALQTWRMFKSVDGTYEVRSAADASLLLDALSYGTFACQGKLFNKESKTQRWTLAFPGESTEIISYPVCVISNVNHPEVSVQITTDSATGDLVFVNALTDEDDTRQQFIRIPSSDGGVMFISVYEREENNRDVAITACGYSDRAAIKGITKGSSEGQGWRIVSYGAQQVRLLCSEHISSCFDTNGDGSAGKQCVVWSLNNGLTQRWTITDISSEPYDGGLPDEEEEEEEEYIETGEWLPQRLAYRIKNVNNNAVAVGLNSLQNVDSIQATMMAVANDTKQLFQLVPNDNGTCSLLNIAHPVLALTAVSPIVYRSSVYGVPINGSQNQQWMVTALSDGTYHLLSKASSSFMLDVNGATVQSDAACIMWENNNGDTQKWILEPVVLDHGGNILGAPSAVRLRNRANPGLVVQFDSGYPVDGAICKVRAASTLTRQVFEIDWLSTDTVRFLSMATPIENRLIITADSLTYAGAVTGRFSNPSLYQSWRVVIQQDGSYRFMPTTNTGWMLDTEGTPPIDGCICEMWASNSLATQKWMIEPVVYCPVPLLYIRNYGNPSVVLQFDSAAPYDGVAMSTGYTAYRGLNQLLRIDENHETLTCRFSNLVATNLFVSAPSLTVRGSVQGHYPDVEYHQYWIVERQGDGSVHLLNADNPLLMLDTTGTVATNSSAAIMFDETGWSTQKWTIEPVHLFRLPLATSVEYTVVRIRSICTPTVAVDVNVADAGLTKSTQTSTIGESLSQLFIIEDIGNNKVRFLCKENPAFALTTKTYEYRGEVTAEIASVANLADQGWYIRLQNDGTYHIVSASHESLLLDTNGSVTQHGSGCILWGDNSGTTQKWIVEPVELGEYWT